MCGTMMLCRFFEQKNIVIHFYTLYPYQKKKNVNKRCGKNLR